MKRTLTILFYLLTTTSGVVAQNMSINTTGTEPNASAMLDVQSTSQGLLIPRMTEAQRLAIVSAADGLMVYQTDGASGLYIYDGPAINWEHSLDSSDVAALIATAGDNLGNHSMTQDFATNGFSISNDGDIEGVSINLDGSVNITGATAGATNLTVNGMVQTSGSGSGLELSNNQIAVTGDNGGTGDLRLRTNSTDRLMINSSGRLGFGTTNPNGDFHVADDTLRVQTPNNFSGTHFIIEGSRHNAGASFSTIDLRNIDVTDGNVSYSGARIESQNPGGSDDGDLRFSTTNNLISSLAMRIDENGQVGIGTSTPSDLLDVNGSIEANGEFKYAIPDTNFTSIPPSAFVSARPESYELNALGVILYISIGGSGGTPGWAVAPLEVPNGATVIEVTYVYYDNDGTNNFNAAVTRYGNLATTGTNLFSFTSAGSSASYQSSTVTSSFTVDYENFAYNLQFEGVRGSANIRLKNVIVKYVVDQAD